MKESDQLAQKLFSRVIRSYEVIPQFVHAYNGHPMRGVTLGVFLDSLHVTRSYSRPRVSNDNAFIESWNKTLKYTVGYPDLMAKQKHPLRWQTHKVRCYGAVPVTIVCRPLIQRELF